MIRSEKQPTIFTRARALFLCVGLFHCVQVQAMSEDTTIYSDRDVTGGIVVAKGEDEISIRETGSGKVRSFDVLDRGDGPEIQVTINGRKGTFEKVKVGMRASISFFRKADKKKITGNMPMISLEAIAATQTAPKK